MSACSSMANMPSYYRTYAPVTSMVHFQEHRFHVYLRQKAPSQPRLANGFDWDLVDGSNIGATVIGRLQGVLISAAGVGSGAPKHYFSSNLVLTDDRFEESTLNVQGRIGYMTTDNGNEGDWAVLGGTGEFACAQGTVAYKRIKDWPNRCSIIDLNIRVVCLTFPKPKPVQKVGPWGGNGGTPYEIQEDDQLPKRLDSVKIYADDNVIQSIAFSYFDQAGQKRTVGQWHRDDGMSQSSTIQFRPKETVKEIFGSTGNYGGHTVVTSLAIVTNLDVYGLYGKQAPAPGNIDFREIAPENHSVVGFYGRLGQVVHKIGGYVRHDDD